MSDLDDCSEIPIVQDYNKETPKNFQKEPSIKQTTIINVENCSDLEDSEKKKIFEPIFSPRIKENKKTQAYYFSSETKPDGISQRKQNFHDFLSKMEKYEKEKNEKRTALLLLKKQQEDKELSMIPKVKMSENSKKIIENKYKNPKSLKSTPHGSSSKLTNIFRGNSKSNKNLSSKKLLETSSKKLTERPVKQPLIQENFSNFKSEKVLAAKFIKEFNNKFDKISKGKADLNIDESKLLLIDMHFLANVTGGKTETEEKLFQRF